jgi:membrane-bound lytic murein transglycosylase A
MGGCSTARRSPAPLHHVPPLRVVPASQWPLLTDDLDLESLENAVTRSLGYLEGLIPETRFVMGPWQGSAAELARAAHRFLKIMRVETDAEQRTAALKKESLLLKSTGRDAKGEVLITGYFEPLLQARRQPDERFKYPVYGVPADLITVDLRDFGLDTALSRLCGRLVGKRLVPYPDREAIDFQSALGDAALPLAYLEDLVALFFLHVQGSGTLELDGELVRVGYAQTNGRPYRSIGKLLLDEGVMSYEEMSMQAIVAFLSEHPEQLRRVLSYNPSYVFFRELSAEGGPLGCYEIPLTAGRSIATDRRVLPAPVVAYLRGSLPDTSAQERELARFVVNQDTGGAIQGPGRVDLFWGLGDAAGELAGRTKHLGELYVLVPASAPTGSGERPEGD